MASKLRTALCDLFGTEYPIVQVGMGGFASPELAVAVSKAGALGSLSASWMTADAVRSGIRKVRASTDRPFAINLLVPPELRGPTGPAPAAGAVAAMHRTLDGFRTALGLPAKSAPPEPLTSWVGPNLEVLIEEKVPVFFPGLGDPGAELVERCHRAGMKVVPMVTTVAEAKIVEAEGVDAIVAQGWEAGGHRGHFVNPPTLQTGSVGTLALVREVVDTVKVPVLAAGGISDGRGIAAALALGAAGVSIGTRFLATPESLATPNARRALVGRTADDTAVTEKVDGRWARLLRNRLVDGYLAKDAAESLPYPWQRAAASDVYAWGQEKDDPTWIRIWAGQGIGMIKDLPGAGEVVVRLVEETRSALRRVRDLAPA